VYSPVRGGGDRAFWGAAGGVGGEPEAMFKKHSQGPGNVPRTASPANVLVNVASIPLQRESGSQDEMSN
jgi:hypothetical protein